MRKFLCAVLAFQMLGLFFAPSLFSAEKLKINKSLFLQGTTGQQHNPEIEVRAQYLALKRKKQERALKYHKRVFAKKEVRAYVEALDKFALAAVNLKKPVHNVKVSQIKEARAWLKKRRLIHIIKDNKYRKILLRYYFKILPLNELEKEKSEALSALNERLKFGKDSRNELSQCNEWMKKVLGSVQMFALDFNEPTKKVIDLLRGTQEEPQKSAACVARHAHSLPRPRNDF